MQLTQKNHSRLMILFNLSPRNTEPLPRKIILLACVPGGRTAEKKTHQKNRRGKYE